MLKRTIRNLVKVRISRWTVYCTLAVLIMPVLAACQPIAPEAVQAASPQAIEPVSTAVNVYADTTVIRPFMDFDTAIPGGQSTLIRTDNSITINMEATGMAPGEAHTLWWVVFNHPEYCVDPHCVAPEDFANPDVAAYVGYATGAIADADGNAQFRATLALGEAPGALETIPASR